MSNLNAILPFVSVIIPTFNRVDLLKLTVKSVREQTFQDSEIIVVNDGSSDGTAEWLATQEDIRSFDRTNSGIAASRNFGAQAARGQWFAFLDHDDLWAPDKLQLQVDFISKNPHIAMIGAKHVRLGRKTKNRGGRTLVGDLFLKEYSESLLHTSSVMIRRDIFAHVGGFPTVYRFADEFDVWLKITKGFPTAYIDQPLVYIRFYDANTSHNRIGVRSDTLDILTKHYDPERIPESVYRRVMSDHDISFGRAYVQIGDTPRAVEWFRKSVAKTPLRFRSWRYYLRYAAVSFFRRRNRADV